MIRIRSLIVTAALLVPLFTQAQAQAQDTSMTFTTQQARSQALTLTLGSGALATLSFPENVTDVLVTRDGLVARKFTGNMVMLAGLTSVGTTPVMITTETGSYTWRIIMSSDQAGRIVSVSVKDPPAPAPVTQGSGNLDSTPANALLSSLVASAPAQDGPVRVSFTAQRDGNVVVVNYRLQGGSADAQFDERLLSASDSAGSVLVRPNLTSVKVAANQVRYGTVILPSPGSAAVTLHWRYRVGLSEYQVNAPLNFN